MGVKRLRKSDRVTLTVPIQVSGMDVLGEDFSERARTLVISRTGATIILNRKLAPVQHIVIRNLGNGKTTEAQIVGQIGGQANGYIYGIVVANPDFNLWNIGFPALTDSEKSVVHVLLECGGCRTREVVYLTELETEVFEANRELSRSCKACNAWTLWKQAVHEQGDDVFAAADLPRPAPPPQRSESGRIQRKDVRLQVRMAACIRQPGFGEEVVHVENVSRGGLSFSSVNSYLEGSRVEIAVPYLAQAPNIFVPARIVRCLEMPGEELRKYGVAYLKKEKDFPRH